MTESTETNVLMKCTKCRYQENVPERVLEEPEFGRRDRSYRIACPNCDSLMLEKSIIDTLNPKKK